MNLNLPVMGSVIKKSVFVLLTALGVYLLNSGVSYSQWFNEQAKLDLASSHKVSAPIFTNSMGETKSVSGEPLIADARPIVLKQYLEAWKSPLANYSDQIISAADTNGVDPNLVIAIAQKETGLGRAVPTNCFNAWGWAQTESYTRCFSSWEEGIRQFTSEFAIHYIKEGLTTPSEIMTRYNPTSPDGSWAVDVSNYLDDVRNFSS